MSKTDLTEDAYLIDLLAKPKFRPVAEFEATMAKYINSLGLRHYFLNKLLLMVERPGVEQSLQPRSGQGSKWARTVLGTWVRLEYNN